MRIRTQLLCAFLLLAVLPLVGIVGFSYVNSQRAIGRAAAAEAAELSADMEERMTSARERLQARMQAVPWDALAVGDSEQDVAARIAEVLGDFAPMLDALTFIPHPPVPPPRPGDSPGEEVPPAPAPRPPVAPAEIESVEIEVAAADPDVGRWQPRESSPAESSRVFIFRDPGVFREPGEDGTIERRFEFQLEAPLDGEPIVPPPAMEALPPAERDRAFEAWQQAAELDLEAVRRQVESELERHRRALGEERTRLVFGERALEIRQDGELIGSLRPQINPDRLLDRVFRGTFAARRERRGEIPFAVDREGRLYTAQAEDRARLEMLGIAEKAAGESWRAGDWVIATSADEPTGLRLGVARPIGNALRELRASALRNLVFGLALIALAVLGMLPVSSRISRGVRQVAEGAERIARGDLETRLPVRGRGELAHLARAFNSMAHDVRDHQERLIAEERRRRDQEVERQLMQAELDRQRRELDEARAFQLSMLPRDLPEHALWEAAVFVETATEVGGDYYDFRLGDLGGDGDARLTVVIGDATGHGARAGTMVTVIKSLFSAHEAAEQSPAAFLRDAGRTVRRMQLGRMAMALAVLRLEERHAVLSNAGMPPLLHHRRDRESSAEAVTEILLPGMPLGALGAEYEERRFDVAPGDTLLLYSDGLPEQPDAHGSPAGYELVKESFERAVDASPRQIVEALAATVEELTDGEAPQDDVTILVLRRR